MSKISFTGALLEINSWRILLLPKEVSQHLPSRGMVFVQGLINNHSFHEALEPDGKGSHWMNLSDAFIDAAGLKIGDRVTVSLIPAVESTEPEIPKDLQGALVASEQAHAVWLAISPLARWDWIRWIRATKNPETRLKRIMTTCDMLAHGKRRPCCFNRNLCTETAVSKNGILLDP